MPLTHFVLVLKNGCTVIDLQHSSTHLAFTLSNYMSSIIMLRSAYLESLNSWTRHFWTSMRSRYELGERHGSLYVCLLVAAIWPANVSDEWRILFRPANCIVNAVDSINYYICMLIDVKHIQHSSFKMKEALLCLLLMFTCWYDVMCWTLWSWGDLPDFRNSKLKGFFFSLWFFLVSRYAL